jgi:hypothetical protein
MEGASAPDGERMTTRPNASPDRMDPYVRALIDNARKKGYLTYDELNQELPEDAVDNIDDVLSKLEPGSRSVAVPTRVTSLSLPTHFPT